MSITADPSSPEQRAKAFEQFFRDNYMALYHFALQMIGEEEVCRDLVSDAFEVVWKNYASRETTGMRTVAYNIVKNKCVDYIRREKSKERYAEFVMHLCDRTDNTEALMETEQRIQRMMTAIDQLTPTTQQVLRQCYFNNKRYAEVAAEMGISVSAVSKHMVQALKTLRAKVYKNVKS